MISQIDNLINDIHRVKKIGKRKPGRPRLEVNKIIFNQTQPNLKQEGPKVKAIDPPVVPLLDLAGKREPPILKIPGFNFHD